MTTDFYTKPAVSDTQLREITALRLNTICHEHFTPIIGRAQVLYMLDKFQSFSALKEQLRFAGYEYYQIFDGDEFCGYCGMCLKKTADCF